MKSKALSDAVKRKKKSSRKKNILWTNKKINRFFICNKQGKFRVKSTKCQIIIIEWFLFLKLN
jgi:hypothetical protein